MNVEFTDEERVAMKEYVEACIQIAWVHGLAPKITKECSDGFMKLWDGL